MLPRNFEKVSASALISASVSPESLLASSYGIPFSAAILALSEAVSNALFLAVRSLIDVSLSLSWLVRVSI